MNFFKIFELLVLLLLVFVCTSEAKIVPIVQSGHSKSIMSVAIDPTGKYIVSGSHDDTVKIWELKTGRLINTLKGHSYMVNAIAIDPTGKYIVSGGNDKTIKVWDFETGKLVNTLKGHSDYVKSVDINGKYIVSGSWDKTIKIWSLKTGKLLKTLKNKHYIVESVAIDPKGQFIVSGNYKTINVWELKTGRLINNLKGHSDKVHALAIDSTGKYIVSGSEDETVKIWELKTGRLINTLKGHYPSVYSVAIDPMGKYIVSGGSTQVNIWGLKTGKLLKSFKGSGSAVAVDPTGQFVASSGGTQMKIWNLKSGKLLKAHEKYPNWIYSVAVDSTGRYIISGSRDDTVKIWELKTGNLINTLKGHSGWVQAVAVDPTGKYIVSGSQDDTVKIWELKTGNLINTLKGHSSGVSAVAIDTSGQYIVSGSYDNTIRIWNLKSGKLLKTLKGHSWHVKAVTVDPTGKYIVSGWRSKIKVWSLKTGKLLRTLEGHPAGLFAVAVDPTGKYIVSGGRDNTIRIWNLKSGKLLKILKGHSANVFTVAIDPTGKYIVSGSQDDTVKIWELKTGNLISTLKGHSGWVEAVAVDPTGKYIVSGSQDTSIIVWNLGKRKLLSTLYSFSNASIVITPENYFFGTGNYNEYIHFVDDNLEVYSFDQFAKKFYRPEMVQLVLSGKELTKLETIDTLVSKKPAPLIKIIFPKDRLVTSNETVEIKVEITDKGGGIGDIYLYLNNSLVSTDTRAIRVKRKGNSKFMTFKVSLLQGNNNIKLIAYNKDNSMSSNPDSILIVSDYRFGAPTLYVLAVGIDIYENDDLNLRYAVDDTKLFTKTIKSQSAPLFKAVRITTLTKPNETTKMSIIKAFKRLSDRIKACDYFLFFNASHGFIATFDDGDSKYFMITSNVIFTDPQNLKKHAISQDHLVKLIGMIPAQNKIIVLDTCQSGEAGRVIQIAMAGMQKTYTRGMSITTAMQLLKMSSGSSVFTASQSVEDALEGYKGHGLFTYTIAEGLKGGADENQDKFITLNELKSYTERNVFIRSKKHFNRKQIPYINVGTLDLSISQVK